MPNKVNSHFGQTNSFIKQSLYVPLTVNEVAPTDLGILPTNGSRFYQVLLTSVELVIGIEPTTCGLQGRCSTIEPHQHIAAPRSGFVDKAGTSGAINQPSFNILRTASRIMNYNLLFG